MVSKKVLASVCLATLLVGTQAAADNTGVESVAGNASDATAVSAAGEAGSELSQIQLLEQAIREVEAQVAREGQSETVSSEAAPQSTTQQISPQSAPVLSKVTPVMKYQGQQPVQHAQGSTSPAQAPRTVYRGGTGLSAETPSAPLVNDEGFKMDAADTYEPGFIQEFDNGAINWLTGVVTATGESYASGLEVSSRQARLRTVRAATIEARKNLFKILGKIPVTERLHVRNILHSDEDVMQYVRGDMQNSRIVSTAFNEDGVATVTVSVTLRGMFLEKLIGKRVSFHRLNKNPYSGSTNNAAGAQNSLPITYTGLLVDARDVGVNPAITMNIVDEAGQVLYSPRIVTRNVALKKGMVEYAGSWEEGVASERSASNPLILKAVTVQGTARNNIVISDEQAQLLKQINNANKFLEEGRVVVVCR